MYLLLPFLSQEEDNSKKEVETKNMTRKNTMEKDNLHIRDSEQSRSLLKTWELKRNQVIF